MSIYNTIYIIYLKIQVRLRNPSLPHAGAAPKTSAYLDEGCGDLVVVVCLGQLSLHYLQRA